MAISNTVFNQIQTATDNAFIPGVNDSIFDTTSALKYLKSKDKIKVEGGDRITWAVEYARNAKGGAYAKGEIFDTTDTEILAMAELSWKYHEVPVTLFGPELARNKSKHARLDFTRTKLNNARKSMEYNITTGVFNDGTTDTDNINGLQQICNVDREYGGSIDSTVYTWWDSYRDTSSHSIAELMSSAGVERIDYVLMANYNKATYGEYKPDFALSTSQILEIYAGRVTSQFRLVNKNVADLGINSLSFYGKPIIEDSQCTANYTYWLNTKTLSLVTDNKRAITFDGWLKPTNQDAMIGHFYWMGNLVCKVPRSTSLATSMGAS